MHPIKIFWSGLLLFFSYEMFGSYTYPVDLLPCNNSVLYMVQESQKNLLVSYDMNTKMKESLLSCQYSPYHVSLLKDGNGFSFVDSDLLYIKQCAVRSPRVVNFSYELYGIGPVTWINTAQGYFSAMLGHWMGLFEVDIMNDDATKKLIWQEDADCYAPFKGDKYLFYVLRKWQEGKYHFFIQRCLYESPSMQESVYQSSDVIIELDVLSDKELFFVTCVSNDNDSLLIKCFYNHLINKEGIWCIKNLFTFFIPHSFLSSPPEGLYDCFAPFMPRRYENSIVFVSQNNEKRLELFYYDIIKKTISLGSNDSEYQHAFVPLLVKDTIFHGGKIVS